MSKFSASKLSKSELNKVFYSSIFTKEHLRTRYITYLLTFLSNMKYIFKKTKMPVVSNKPAILFFSVDAYMDTSQFDDYDLLIYKEKVSSGIKICFKREEALMSLAFVVPYFIRKHLYRFTYASIEKKLKPFDIRFFICNNPELLNYPIAFYLKTIGVPSGTIQHGVYMPDHYQPNYYETNVAEYVFVWGNVYKETFNRQGVSLDKLHLFCPPFYFNLCSKNGQTPKPVFLGQQFYKLSKTIGTPYNEVVEKLAIYYKERGIRLHYKAHPREDITNSLTSKTRNLVDISPIKRVNDEFFNNYTHAFSFSSTALVKALCAGLACYQTNHISFDLANIDYYKYARIPMVYVDNMEEELNKPIIEVTEEDIDNSFLYLKKDFLIKNANILRACILKNENSF